MILLWTGVTGFVEEPIFDNPLTLLVRQKVNYVNVNFCTGCKNNRTEKMVKGLRGTKGRRSERVIGKRDGFWKEEKCTIEEEWEINGLSK